jgi:hypothetical protein
MRQRSLEDTHPPVHASSPLSLSLSTQHHLRRPGLGLWIFSKYECAELCGPRTHWEEAELGRATSRFSGNSDIRSTGGVGLKRMYSATRDESIQILAYTLRALDDAGDDSWVAPRRWFRGAFAVVGLGGATPAHRSTPSRELFESPKLKDGQSRRSSQANAHGATFGS